MTTVTLTWQRLGRGRRTEGQAERVEVAPGLLGQDFLDALAEVVFDIADRNLISEDIWVNTAFDEDSTHAGTFSINAQRFGHGRWEVT